MRQGILWTLAFIIAVGPFSIDTYLPALPLIVQEFDTSPALVHLTLTGFLIGMALGQLVAGVISDAVGRKKVLIVGAIMVLVTAVCGALAHHIAVLIAARLLQGIGAGACVVVARAIVPDLFKGDAAAKAFTLMMMMQSIAPIIAPILGGYLVGPTGWRGIFWCIAGLALVQLLVVLVVIPETRDPELRSPIQPHILLQNYKFVLSNRAFLGFALAGAMGFATMFSYIAASPFVVQEQMGFSAKAYSLIFGANACGLLAGGAVNNRLLGRYRPIQLLRLGLTVQGVGVIGLLVAACTGLPAWLFFSSLLCTITPLSMITGNATALATGLVRAKAGSGAAIMGGTQFVLAGLITPLVGIGQNTALTMSICMLVCALVAQCAVIAGRKSAA